MSAIKPDFASLLAVYAGNCQPQHIELSDSPASFSGSKLWRLKTDRGWLCLRRWPAEYPRATQLSWIHAVLAAAHAAGFQKIPLPISTLQGQSYVEHDACLWELTPWLPGEADQPHELPKNSSKPRIHAALAALAEFHVAIGRSPLPLIPKLPALGPSPGLSRRAEQLGSLLAGGIDQLERQVRDNALRWPELAQRSQPLFRSFRSIAAQVFRSTATLLATTVQIQPCIRDIHRDHVFFAGNTVTGLIDFGSMKPDHIAGDIARLLGSMALNDVELWQAGLRSYETVRPLSHAERQLVHAYDKTAVLLSGVNWLEWIFVDLRQFNNSSAILGRFDVILSRMEQLAKVTTY